jgi:hypothetical protein
VQGSSDRAFGIVMTVFFLLVGVFPAVRGGAVRAWALAVACVFLIAAVVRPGILSPLNVVWTRFGLLLHRIVSPVILAFLFYVVFTPFGLVMRLIGNDPMRRRGDPDASSYWIPRNPPGPDGASMRNQF